MSVGKFFILRYVLLCIPASHFYEETLPPDFAVGIFQINKHGVFVHLESVVYVTDTCVM